MPQEDNVALIRSDLVAHAKTLTAYAERIAELENFRQDMKVDLATRNERATMTSYHITEINKKLDSIYSLGKWLLLSFGLIIVTAISQFILRGGLNVGG